MNTTLFLTAYFAIIFSCIGHGIIFCKLIKINFNLNIGLLGILGLINLTFFSYIVVFIFNEKVYLNLLLIIMGNLIFFLSFYKKKNKY